MTNKTTIASSQKIVSNTIFSSMSEVSLIFTSIFYILAARLLGDVDFGKFSTAAGFVGIFTLIVIFGFTYSITKVIVKNRDRAGVYAGNAMFIQIVFAAISFIICLFSATIIGYPKDVKAIIVFIFVAETLKCLGLTMRASCKALGAFHYDTIAVNAERIFLMVVGGGLLFMGKGLLVISIVLVIARAIGFLLLLKFFYRLDSKVFQIPSIEISFELLKKSWIYVVQSVFWRVYNHIDVVMISMMRSFSEVGWYSAGRRIIEGLWFIPNIVTEAVYPEMSARHLVSKQLVVKLFERSFKYILVIAALVCMVSLIVAKPLVLLIFGPTYANTVIVFVLLSVSIIPSFLCYLFGNTLIAINLQVKETYVSISRSVFNVVMNLILIPFWGYIGATVATVATDFFTLFGYVFLLKKAGIVQKSQLYFVYKPILAIFVLVVLYLFVSEVHLFFQLVIFVFLYVLLVLLLQIFDNEEKDIFRKFIKDKLKK